MLPIPFLNAVDVGSESLSATQCPTKAFSEYLVEAILAFVEALGHNVVMLHSDQELVMVQLLKAVPSARVKRTLVRHGLRASHQSQGKIENANQVINGVCRAKWLSLENLLQEKLSSDSILIAWLIRHAAWSLTRFQVKNEGRTAFVRVFFGKAYTSQVLPCGERGMRRSEMEPWNLGWQGANHRRTHHSRLPWNGRAENLKATIVTEQDQGPSGHRRVHLTTKVVARFGATHGCSGCVGLGPHTEGCRVRLERALPDERASAGPVGAGVGPIAEPATEPQQPAPGRSRSQRLHHPVLLCRCRHKTSRACGWIRRWRWEHKNAESARERGQARRHLCRR